MKKVGIVLIVLQVIALIGGFASGNSPLLSIGSGADIFEAAGYLAIGVVGIILFVKGSKKEKAAAEAPKSEPAKPSAAGTSRPAFCSKCGRTAEPGDVYCIHCGSRLKSR